MIRRKSDAQPKEREHCAYHEQMQAERANQREHEMRQFELISGLTRTHRAGVAARTAPT